MEESLGRRGYSLMTASAAAAMEINLSRFRASSTVLLGMTSCERIKRIFCHIISLCGSSVRNAVCFIDVAKRNISVVGVVNASDHLHVTLETLLPFAKHFKHA